MKRRKSRRAALWLILLLLLCIGAFCAFERAVRPTLSQLCEARVEAEASRAMHTAVLEVLSAQAGDSLLKVYTQNGRAYLLETDSFRLNRLASDCAILAQDRILAIGEQGVSVPIGTAIGGSMFNGVGPRIRVRFTPTGTVTADCESSFADRKSVV